MAKSLLDSGGIATGEHLQTKPGQVADDGRFWKTALGDVEDLEKVNPERFALAILKRRVSPGAAEA